MSNNIELYKLFQISLSMCLKLNYSNISHNISNRKGIQKFANYFG